MRNIDKFLQIITKPEEKINISYFDFILIQFFKIPLEYFIFFEVKSFKEFLKFYYSVNINQRNKFISFNNVFNSCIHKKRRPGHILKRMLEPLIIIFLFIIFLKIISMVQTLVGVIILIACLFILMSIITFILRVNEINYYKKYYFNDKKIFELYCSSYSYVFLEKNVQRKYPNFDDDLRYFIKSKSRELGIN